MNIQFIPKRSRALAVTNVGEFRPYEVKLINPDQQARATKLVSRSAGEFIVTGLAPGIHPPKASTKTAAAAAPAPAISGKAKK